ncbi:hypothetical protein [uncultured Sphingomonas sp.]|uniref:hypothetical protein n=1 Tax=uncultured Sphingomonas sp. TaxID=158754 RepID=UPI0035CAE7E3
MDQPYIDKSSTEDLGRILMALVQEVWVMRDRMAITEKLLADRAGITPTDIDDYVTDAADTTEIEALRQRFVAKVIGAPSAARDRSVDQILKRAGFGAGQSAEHSTG